MAITNHERVGKLMELLKEGLHPFVEREFSNIYKGQALAQAARLVESGRQIFNKPFAGWDVALLLRLMWDAWRDVFRNVLGQAERTLVSELRDVRNKWAHQEPFSTDDAYRAMDSAARLLNAISASQAADVDKMRMEILRVRFDEQARTEKRKSAGTAIESQVTGSLKPWREVVTPHKDVASGRYMQAEFAADLWQVHLGEGSDEYRNPVEFFRRTYLTDSLKKLLVDAVRRLAGSGGPPVVQLQTNFGGGKTHSMLALYHLLSGASPSELVGIDVVLREADVKKLPAVKRVVLVGNKISPGNPSTKPDGTVVRTLWGELAWQLGGKKAFNRLKADDEKATSPGDMLRELFNEHGPCLILIDEWVAYARQLHDEKDLPGGTFETHFSFAQTLTESAKLAKQCLLVVSLPASETGSSPHAQADDVEVGGERGRTALDRLRNAIGRLEESWRPASAEEGFEIVRRRLFEPLINKDHFIARDTVAKAFADLYQGQSQEFPPECRDSDYEKRLKAAYPIHPEVFDRLYWDWSTLLKFQRTRGVLRLMAAVIHSLWEKGDRNPLILPSNIPIDDPRVQSELTRYLPDNWQPVIEKDVDGPNALPLRIDGDVPNLGKYAACRRVARTIYMGSAPTTTAANRGLEDRRIKLGCVMPGEAPAIFGDALRRLSSAATYLYQDSARYWYSTQTTVTKLAEDRAEQLKRDPDKVAKEIDARLREDLRKLGDFTGVHVAPGADSDVPDEMEARLVVLGTDHPYGKEGGSPAEVKAKGILERRGVAPRLCRNALVFLAPDRARLVDLDEAVRKLLAWEGILAEKDSQNLTQHQVKQAEAQRKSADEAVSARIPETYQWLLVPVQNSPQAPVEWQATRLSGQDSLAVRASKKLRNEELLLPGLAATRLRLEMDRVPLWRGDHVGLKQLVEDFAKYLYLPRVTAPSVLLEAVREGLSLLTWSNDSFAFADSFDEGLKRYRGLRCGQAIAVSEGNLTGLLVKPDRARQQKDDTAVRTPDPSKVKTDPTKPPGPAPRVSPKRFHGTVRLEPGRAGRDASRIAEEVISHLSGLLGADVKVTLEIEAQVPESVPENVVRTETENARTLKFDSQAFETE